ncbi:MAG: hypothetical protein IPP33_09520 [Flavobacteriales bacterium]|nr:hypothetical protein [Flavobacteriales bacterium]
MTNMIRSLSVLIVACACCSANALTLNLQVQNETCTYANGSVYASVSGGVPPYTYLWGGGETTESISNLSPGTYSVTVTDFVGTQVTEQATVISEDYGTQTYNFPHAYCSGQNYREFFFPPQPFGVPADVGPGPLPRVSLTWCRRPPLRQLLLDLGPVAQGLSICGLLGCERMQGASTSRQDTPSAVGRRSVSWMCKVPAPEHSQARSPSLPHRRTPLIRTTC